MVGQGDRLAGVDLSTAVSLPLWQFVVIAALVGLVSTFVAGPGSFFESKGGVAVRIALVLVIAVAAAWALDHTNARDNANERRALNARSFELRLRALMPGSSLGCLDETAGDSVEEACEKALFASAEATANAVSYVSAQLALLSAGREHARTTGLNYWTLLTDVRHAVEVDRFGIVAHVLARTAGCEADKCASLALLKERSRVNANLSERPFEMHVQNHMTAWPGAAATPVAGNPAALSAVPPPAVAAKPSSKAYFPSASSIPSVTIMAAEPSTSVQPRDSTASADAASAAARKPAPPASQPRQAAPPNGGAPASEPLQIAPLAQ
jgi:hypothetical protein